METTIHQIEKEIQSAKERVQFGEAIERLKSNRDFKKVFLEGYFREEAIRLVGLKADPSQQKEECQQEIIKQIDAIGAVQAFLNAALWMASRGAMDVAEKQEIVNEMIEEGNSNE